MAGACRAWIGEERAIGGIPTSVRDMVSTLVREQFIPARPDVVWDFFATPRNLDALTPPDLKFRIRSALPERMYAGQLIEYRISPLPGLWLGWLTEIRHVREGRYFVDEQRFGPYRFWYHEHHFEAVESGVRMTDRVTYSVAWGWLGTLLDRAWVRRRLEQIFDFRAQRVAELFGTAAAPAVQRPDQSGVPLSL